MAAQSPWPGELDALEAAPAQHRLLLENDRVRVLDAEIAPGERTPVHTHRWPAVHYVVTWSAFIRRDAEGQAMGDSRATGATAAPPRAIWGDALAPHTLENVGAVPLRVISVELKGE